MWHLCLLLELLLQPVELRLELPDLLLLPLPLCRLLVLRWLLVLRQLLVLR